MTSAYCIFQRLPNNNSLTKNNITNFSIKLIRDVTQEKLTQLADD